MNKESHLLSIVQNCLTYLRVATVENSTKVRWINKACEGFYTMINFDSFKMSNIHRFLENFEHFKSPGILRRVILDHSVDIVVWSLRNFIIFSEIWKSRVYFFTRVWTYRAILGSLLLARFLLWNVLRPWVFRVIRLHFVNIIQERFRIQITNGHQDHIIWISERFPSILINITPHRSGSHNIKSIVGIALWD